jgi:hypothetical protein
VDDINHECTPTAAHRKNSADESIASQPGRSHAGTLQGEPIFANLSEKHSSGVTGSY